MVVSLSTGHTTDWEWQAVLGQMEDLRKQNYVMRLKQDAGGSTYWTITTSGINYLHALERFETPVESEPVAAVAVSGTPSPGIVIPAHGAQITVNGVPVMPMTIPAEPPVPAPSQPVSSFVARRFLWIQRSIRWDEMPTHITAHLAYDLLKYGAAIVSTLVIAGVSYGAYRLLHFLIVRALH
jgi:hypothetical protein